MATRNWTGGGADNKASTSGNWDVAPVTGDSVVVGFDARGITWDINSGTVALVAVTFQGNAAASANMVVTLGANTTWTGAVSLTSLHASYTVTLATSTFTLSTGAFTLGTLGILSQTGTAGNITVASYSQSGTGATLLGKVDATFTCLGNFTQSGGTGSSNLLCLILPNSCTFSNTLGGNIYDFTIGPGAAVVNTSGQTVSHSFYIGLGGSLSIGAGNFTYDPYVGAANVFQNLGTIFGTGTFYFKLDNRSVSAQLGTIVCASTSLTTIASPAASYTLTLLGNATLGTTNILSANGTYSITVDLKGFSLSTTGMATIGALGFVSSSVAAAQLSLNGLTIAVNGTLDNTKIAQINMNNTLDTSAGTLTEGKELWVFGGTFTVKMGAAQKMYNVIARTGIRTLLSNITIDNLYAHALRSNTNGFSITKTNPANEFTSLRRPVKLGIKPLDLGPVGIAAGWLRDLGGVL